MAATGGSYLFSVYAHIDKLLAGIKALQKAGYREFQVFSPVPHHDIEQALGGKPSPIRVFTLVGGLLGLAVGWGITIVPLWNYNLHVGGKPLVSIPPFGVVAYICTIFFGAVATLIGLVVTTRLPRLNLVEGFDERISSDHFGIQVHCEPGDVRKLTRVLEKTGAITVKRVGP